MWEPIHRLFNDPRWRRLAMRLRKPLGIVAVMLLATQARQEWFWPGIAVSAVGALGQLWCFGSLKTQKVLAVRGPYMFVRNPMYLARFVLILGLLMLTGNPWVPAAYVPLYYFYMVNRVRREEARLRALFGPDYEAYCRDVHRFVPTLKRFEWRPLWFFDRECFSRNHGVVNAVAILALYVLLYVGTFVWAA